ncbi:hypothetical protein B566_EDAN002232 [Ephemera danica]|nr:hypothetical protein B566_EDAN002232 [Ephemera danica]
MFSRKKPEKVVAAPVRKVNEDLEKERKKCTFNPLELTLFLDGGKDKYDERREREEYFLSDPALQDTVPPELLSHEDQYRNALRKACHLFRKMKSLREKELLGGTLGSAMFKDGNPLTLHYVMFVPTLMGQELGTAELLTELGHGTNIRALETTATYLPETEQFELNSPTLTSYKWWPGGLGHTANFAVVVAQLYTKGQCQGIHPFVVQLRDEKTHRPMPGIKIGEIGRKLGMNSTNNGFLAFNKVHIPRNQMLMKNAQVLPDGTYIKSPSSKLTYGTMMFVRVVVVQDAAVYLAKAVTIATRYSAVRRQSEMKPGEAEPQILDYQTQQYKLLPFLSFYYAFRFSAAWLWDMYNEVTSDIDRGDLEQLPELHATSCCLKAVCTADAAKAVETVRLACGGHGYMTCSNLPTTYGLVTAMCTYEGENTVMLLQTARALMKALARAQAGEKLTSTVAYLALPVDRKLPWSNTVDGVVQGFQQIAAGKVVRCGELLKQREASGLQAEDAWNCVSVQLVEAAEAHCRAFIVERYVEAIRTGMKELSPELQAVMQQLCELYCVFWVLLKTGDFLLYTGMHGSDISYLENWQSQLLTKLRPNAVGLVDSFDFRDEVLGSALGAWDGQVYERLLESAMKSPLNSKPVHDSFHASIAPLLKAKY